MAENNNDAPKIHVDSDWKAQAQAEKQRLAEQQETAAQKPPGGAAAEAPGAQGGAADQQQRPRQIPPASFATLVQSLATQTLFALGGYEDPQTKRRYVDLDLAKHHIDTLSVVEEKTQGNLSDEEKKLLDNALYETRMHYVQVAQASSRLSD